MFKGKFKSKMNREKVFNIPNLLTSFRLLMIPIFLYFYFTSPGFPFWFLLLLAFLTDFLDGQVARRLKEVTQFGAFFDPLVDRLFVFSVVVAYSIGGHLPLVFALPVLVRDFLVAAGYLFLRTHKISLSVSTCGKVATFLIFCSLVMVAFPGTGRFGLYVYVLGALAYLYAGLDYFFSARFVLKRGSLSNPRITNFLGV